MVKEEKGGKKQKKKNPGNKVYKIYEVSGSSLKRKNRTCPKCGPGTFLSNHKDRYTCGKCWYMERK